ncbi:MAG: hypothetical protein F2727_03535, partial [Actinobacteria bacterium]|nr:hypothetical protein [Actinomycetota bacterium]
MRESARPCRRDQCGIAPSTDLVAGLRHIARTCHQPATAGTALGISRLTFVSEPVLWPAPQASAAFNATVHVPGSKSITNRALIL